MYIYIYTEELKQIFPQLTSYNMKTFIVSILRVISQTLSQTSGSCAGDCCRTFLRCPANVPDYFSTYSDTNCKGFHVHDGIRTQITFMSQE